MNESKTIDSLTYTTAYTYDDAERVQTMTYPDGEVLTYGYNAQGLPDSLTGKVTYVQSTTYDEAGRVDILTLGQGKIDHNYYGWTETGSWPLDISKSTKGGALSNIKVTKGTPELLDLHYFYDVVGNIEHINDWQPEKNGAPKSTAMML